MKPKYVLELLTVLLLAAACQAGDTNPPITFRHVDPGDFSHNGTVYDGTAFWVTNHTQNEFRAMHGVIETKDGTNWVAQSRPIDPILFRPVGQRTSPEFRLGPNMAAYAVVQLPSQPTGTVWRLRADFYPVLTGLSDTEARIKHYPDMLRQRIQSGNTNAPLNPFTTNMSFLGKRTSVVTQEISDQ
jgi:hypothetical protein